MARYKQDYEDVAETPVAWHVPTEAPPVDNTHYTAKEGSNFVSQEDQNSDSNNLPIFLRIRSSEEINDFALQVFSFLNAKK